MQNMKISSGRDSCNTVSVMDTSGLTNMHPINLQARTFIVRSTTTGDCPVVTPNMFYVFISINYGNPSPETLPNGCSR
jgi:hypothetical protein